MSCLVWSSTKIGGSRQRILHPTDFLEIAERREVGSEIDVLGWCVPSKTVNLSCFVKLAGVSAEIDGWLTILFKCK